MDRRTFVTGLGTILAAPLTAEAQQARKVWRIGLIGPATPKQAEPFVAVFRQRMRELGWVEGENYTIDQRWAAGQHERFPDLATELARSNAMVIVAWSTPAIMAAKQATRTIPIVMASSTDAVESGFVASLARPGGNITGVSLLTSELSRKYVELLRELIPGISRIGVLYDPTNASDLLQLRELQATARFFGLQMDSLVARNLAEIESAFAGLRKTSVAALVVLGGGVNFAHRKRLFELVSANRLGAIYSGSDYTKDGGLMSYGVSLLEFTRVAADYVDKILRGRTPADLPIQQPTKFELVINLKTAKALGLTIPPALLLRADQVIE